MKGILFKDSIEYQLFVEGESWQQNQVITGKLTLKNHKAQESLPISSSIRLAKGLSKKVSAKEKDAFSIITQDQKDSIVLNANEEKEVSWSISLPRHALLTEKSQSLYLLYANEGDQLESALQINILPAQFIQDFFNIFNTYYKFKIKSIKTNKKGLPEAKLVIPDSKEYSQLDSLSLQIELSEDDKILSKWMFKIKHFDFSSSTSSEQLKVQKRPLVIEECWKKEEVFMSYGDQVDHQKVNNKIKSILEKTKLEQF